MGVPVDSRFLGLVVHDLRTPLGTIVTSLHLIQMTHPTGPGALAEDLNAIRQSSIQIQRMMDHLADFCRVAEASPPTSPSRFDPRWLAREVIDEQTHGPKALPATVELEVGPDCPAEVQLDPGLAGVALRYAMANASAGANGGPVRLRLDGGDGRLRVGARVDAPAPDSVRPADLRADAYVRLLPVPAERRGIDLAIVARVADLLSGSARLEVAADRSTTVAIDWPTRLDPAAAR